MRFMADEMALEEVFLRVHRFSPTRIILSVFHTHLHLHAELTRGTNGRFPEILKNQRAFENGGSLGRKVFSLRHLIA